MRNIVLLRLTSTLPDPILHLPCLDACPQHDATVLLGRRVLRLWLLVPRWSCPPSRLFRSTPITTLQVPSLALVLATITALLLIPVLLILPSVSVPPIFPSPFSLLRLWCPVRSLCVCVCVCVCVCICT